MVATSVSLQYGGDEESKCKMGLECAHTDVLSTIKGVYCGA